MKKIIFLFLFLIGFFIVSFLGFSAYFYLFPTEEMKKITKEQKTKEKNLPLEVVIKEDTSQTIPEKSEEKNKGDIEIAEQPVKTKEEAAPLSPEVATISPSPGEVLSSKAKKTAVDTVQKKQEMLRWKRLAKIYSSMDAEKAAVFLESIDVGTAVQILSAMRERQAAEIMSYMDTDRVTTISKKMANGSNG
jgi:flagellar motility protein MotE (MotC chaperone)